MLRPPIPRLILVIIGLAMLGLELHTLSEARVIRKPAEIAARNTQLLIAADHDTILFPGDCLTMAWRVTGNNDVKVDDQSVPTQGRRQFCDVGFNHMPNVSVNYADGMHGTLILPIVVASMQPQNWILPALALVCFLLALQPFRWLAPEKRPAARLLALTCIIIGSMAVFQQVDLLNTNYGYLTVTQLLRHTDVLTNQAPGQWQYRVLMEFLVEGLIRLFALVGINFQTAFIVFRILQNFIFLLVFATYLRALKLPWIVVYVGLAMVFWNLSNMLYDSDLQFNTYADATFYVIAALLIVKQRYGWLVPLTLVAALNRETSLLIPLMLVAAEIDLRKPFSLSRRVLAIAFASGAVYVVAQVGLRLVYGFKPGIGAFGLDPGIEIFLYNVGREFTWRMLLATFSIIPLIAIAVLRKAPAVLQRFFWAIVPLWFLVHVFVALDEETRIFLVPVAVVFIPIVLCVLVTQVQASLAPVETSAPQL